MPHCYSNSVVPTKYIFSNIFSNIQVWSEGDVRPLSTIYMQNEIRLVSQANHVTFRPWLRERGSGAGNRGQGTGIVLFFLEAHVRTDCLVWFFMKDTYCCELYIHLHIST